MVCWVSGERARAVAVGAKPEWGMEGEGGEREGEGEGGEMKPKGRDLRATLKKYPLRWDTKIL